MGEPYFKGQHMTSCNPFNFVFKTIIIITCTQLECCPFYDKEYEPDQMQTFQWLRNAMFISIYPNSLHLICNQCCYFSAATHRLAVTHNKSIFYEMTMAI